MGFQMGVATLGLKATAAAAAKNPERNGNCRDICCEAGEERYSKTITRDPSRSSLNEHLGKFASGVEAYEYIREEVEKAEEIHRVKSKQGRGFRKDKSIAYAFIFKPDSEWVNAQDKATLDRFFDDAFATACELGVFNKNTDVVLRERHYDEAAAHEHIIVMEKTPDGDLAGPEFLGLPKFDLLNHKLPEKMRERGWDMDELGRGYDPAKAKQMTPEELAEYKADCVAKKKAKHGRSANEYIADKRAEEANERAEKAVGIAAEATALAAEAEATRKEVEASIDESRELAIQWDETIDYLEDRYDALNAQTADAQQELADMEPKLKRGRAEIASLDVDKAKAKAEKDKAEAEAEAAKKERQRAFEERLAMGKSLTQVKTNVDRREKQLAELDETIAERTAAVAAREAEIARKEAEAERKLKAAQDVIETAETVLDDAKKEADGAFGFLKSFLETRLRKTSPKALDTMLGWINGAQKAYAERMETKREKVSTARRSVSIAQPTRRSDEDSYDF